MITNTTFVDRDHYHKEIQKLADNVSERYQNISSLLTEDLTSIDSNTLHLIGKLLQPKNSLERSFYKLLGHSLLQAESLAGNSANIGLVFSLNLLKQILGSDTLKAKPDVVLVQEYDEILERLKTAIQASYQVPTLEDLDQTIAKVCEDYLLTKVVQHATRVAGLEGKIYFENGRQHNFVIERRTGYNFKVKPFKFFLDTSGNWERQNVKVLLIDGVIEQVSEIDQILNAALVAKQPAAIICRGFSEEVIATLKANFDRGLLDVLPVRINSDVESINILNDIASVCGTDIVSSLKGDMISCAKWDSLAVVRKIKCLSDKITIEESKTRNKVSSQIKFLLAKRYDSQNIEDVVNLIDERIKALSSESVIVRLPVMSHLENQTTRGKFDTSLRAVKSILNNGLMTFSDLRKNFKPDSSDLEKAVFQGLKETEAYFQDAKMSSLSVLLALSVCGKQTLMIASSNGAVLTED
jgi:hypothetical protein